MSEENANVIKISSSYAKFFIGTLAGCSAVAIPRLSSFLMSDKIEKASFFSSEYIISALVFSVLIGIFITIMEYKIPRPPKETLFAAIALPGIIAGSLNTALEANNTSRIYKQASELSQEVRDTNGIKIESIESIEVVPFALSGLDISKTKKSSGFQLVSSAYADDNTPRLVEKNNSNRISIQIEKPEFAISVGTYSSLDKAKEQFEAIKTQDLSPVIIKTNKAYEILSSDEILSKTDATIKAIDIKNKTAITPKLLKVK